METCGDEGLYLSAVQYEGWLNPERSGRLGIIGD